nr:uncharacterized mitochondrial protein AtMg00810-like [Tanacetum cinerariifolium]
MVEKSKLDEDKEGKAVDPSHYRGMIGTLLYLTASRPDLQFAICMCARVSGARFWIKMENENELSYETLTRVYLGSYEHYKSVGAEVELLEPGFELQGSKMVEMG